MPKTKPPVVLGFYGNSESGKTTLLERLITEITRHGYRVAAVKKTNQPVHMDREGKDTWRFAQAGASPVIFSTPLEIAQIERTNKSEKQILMDLEKSTELDFIFIEGSSDADIPKIRVGNREERVNTLFTYNNDFEKLLELIIRKSNPEK
jgi:molybdopterin-guanine dinucleotide biosynthesis adapter protein